MIPNLKSLTPNTPRRWSIAGVSVLMLLVLIARILGSGESALAALIVGVVCLAAVALAWFLIAFFMRRSRRRRQEQFDAGITAREGIDDRRREWQSWVEELEKNGIDRYELPFYLLVGEPQSGKSVLLQNSDLKFLFGQSRLSGIGGTRGCDWWFTDEAVILDLAGRLFTHEGGASDEAEWEAFLDLVNNFRPLDPANGIMLVIPCDGLLGDSLEVSAQKASKSREALMSLTRKLEAKLPIYVILTKADKIFGFAESVHRLPLEQRHQMFGWSRSAERLEDRFDGNELREAWDGIVQQSVALRDEMLVTARLPEALPEVDRLQGFPEELRGMYEALETYLNRIFVGSDLVEQLYFRGIYLTSGLQSGAPIAKVFVDILDRPGEADERDLEKLFVRQQAYFIKDLIRQRVFGERGLVKPTSSRVERAKRKAWMGYGVAASVAVISLVWGIFEIRSNHEASGQETYDAAIRAAAKLQPESIRQLREEGADPLAINSLLTTLESIEEARDREPTVMQRLHASRQPYLEELYETAYDRRYRPQLQMRAAKHLRDLTEGYEAGDLTTHPGSYEDLVRQAEAAISLAAGISDAASARSAARFVQEDIDLDRVERAHENRGEGFESDPGASAGAARAALRSIRELWLGTLDPVDSVHISGSVGFGMAWRELDLFEERIKSLGMTVRTGGDPDDSVHDDCARAFHVLQSLDESAKQRSSLSTRDLITFQGEGHPAEELLDELFAVDSAGESELPAAWRKEKSEYEKWLKSKGLGRMKLLEDPLQQEIPDDVFEALNSTYLDAPDLRTVTNGEWLGPDACASPASLGAQVATAVELSSSTEPLIATVARLKLLLLQSAVQERYPDWASIHRASCARDPEGPPDDSAEAILRSQTAILDVLAGCKEVSPGLDSLTNRLAECGIEGVAAIKKGLAESSLNTEALSVLIRTADTIPSARGNCVLTIQSHLAEVRDDLNRRWDELENEWRVGDADPAAPVVARQALVHLTSVDSVLAGRAADLDGGRTAWIQQTSRRLSTALDSYTTKLQDAIRDHADLSSQSDLTAACDHITKQLIGGSNAGLLTDWADKLIEEQRVPAANDRSLFEFLSRPDVQSVSKLNEYRRSAQRGRHAENERPGALVHRFAMEFSDGGKALTGSKLAAQFYSVATGLPDLEEDPDAEGHGIDLAFSRELARSLERVVVRQLRAEYLDELVDEIVGRGRDELEAFWFDPAAPRTGQQTSPDAVDFFFADDGRYLRLLDKFGVFQDPERDFRVGQEELGDPSISDAEERRWELDQFLEQMLLYVRNAESLANLSDQERPSFPLAMLKDLEIVLEAVSSAETHETTWNNWDRFKSSLFTSDKATSIQGPMTDPDIIRTVPVKGWSFHERRRFDLQWHSRVGSSEGGWQRFEVQSGLVPLQLFWSDRKTWSGKDTRDRRRTALVDFHVTTNERAPFKLTITPAPPRRPDLRLDDLKSD